MKLSRTGILLSSLPSFIMLVLFYSLAIHIYQSLGHWPESIGDRGFPPSLVNHANVTWEYFEALLLLTLFGLPVTVIVCLLVRRWRRFVLYLGVHAISYIISWGLVLLAPSQFLNWWWD